MGQTANSCQKMLDGRPPDVSGMVVDDPCLMNIPTSFYHSTNQELDLSNKTFKREVGGPYSVMMDNKIGKPHLIDTDQQNFFRDSKPPNEVHAVKGERENSGESEDEDDDDDEDDEEGEDDDEDEVNYKREQIIVEVNLNNQTLNVSKGDKGVPKDPSHIKTSSDDEGGDSGEDEQDSHEDEENNPLTLDGQTNMQHGNQDQITCHPNVAQSPVLPVVRG
ncbi:zinc finger protein 652 [Xenopus tropicalis]|uniref:Zinc finger protein 652 n=1 Tax=Xenopus tropicalis TaxID=8364 RepID=B0BLU5_XENTR|nr:zinc finger protein 652 [Xenopus tropicalis]AAI58165.1 znf652 protein [Xenopus tropicalis]|eukprot:NP_001107727.1 zinc finger protein 652 [Xenopus tropicalis]